MRDSTESHDTCVSIVAEQAVLGAVLLDDCDALELDHLRAEHFFDPLHARLYAYIRAMRRSGKTADPITVSIALAGEAAFAGLGGAQTYLAELAGACPYDPRQSLGYAAHLVDLARRRHVRNAAQDAVGLVSGNTETDVIVTQLVASMDALCGVAGASDRVVTTADAMATAIDRISEAYEAGGGYAADALSLGLRDLDRITGGWRPGQMVVAAGRPGMGKSLFGLRAARSVSQAGGGVLFVSLEMAAAEHAERLIASATGLSYTDLSAGAISDCEYERAAEAAADLARLPIDFRDAGSITGGELAGMVRRRQRRSNPPLKLVVIDHIGLMDGEGRSDYERVSDCANTIKRVAQDSGVPILALCQLNREVEARNSRRPQMSDLRGSGRIEENAHQILLLYRDAYYAEREPEHGDPQQDIERLARMESKTIEIDVAKNRGGRTGRAILFCDAATGRIDDADVDYRREMRR